MLCLRGLMQLVKIQVGSCAMPEDIILAPCSFRFQIDGCPVPEGAAQAPYPSGRDLMLSLRGLLRVPTASSQSSCAVPGRLPWCSAAYQGPWGHLRCFLVVDDRGSSSIGCDC